MAEIKKTPVQLFDNKYGFMETVKYYNDVKVGYDGMISDYGRKPYANYTPANKFGTVVVRRPLSLQNHIYARFQRVERVKEALEWKFSIPLQKGFQVEAHTILSSWDETEILASSFTTGKYVDMGNKTDNINSFSIGGAYGYMQISLSHSEKDTELLQEKIQRWYDRGPLMTNRLIILRVNQFVYPHGDKKEMVEDIFAVRQDSVILEIVP